MRVQQVSTENLVVNNTLYRRISTFASLKKLVVKTGPFVDLTEAATLQFVTKNTSIPVPRVHCSFVYKNRAYFVMDRIKGDTINNMWHSLNETEHECVILQLRRMMRELRELPPHPGTGIESCVGGSLRDQRMAESNPRFGPFNTIDDFHLWLRRGLRIEDFPNGLVDCRERDWKDLKEMAARQDAPWEYPLFTHAELNPYNILVRGCQVVGIIDWEAAGWYPPYWEFTSACYLQIPFWNAAAEEFLNPLPNELKAEQTRQR
ncbi:kinase-like protein [Annulohypoxylon moriforme]|nr:kinase-like protein [Annulohypoxylon moriforme]